MAYFSEPPVKDKPLIQKKAYFLGRFISRDVDDNAMIKLRSLIQYERGVTTKIRLGLSGFSSGEKAASKATSGMFSRRKHFYQFTPFEKIKSLSQDNRMHKVILLMVNLGLGQIEVLVFRLKDKQAATSVVNTFLYIQNVISVSYESQNQANKNLWGYKSKMFTGAAFENFNPFSQELWARDRFQFKEQPSREPSLPGTSQLDNLDGEDRIIHDRLNRHYENIYMFMHEEGRAKDDTFVHYNQSSESFLSPLDSSKKRMYRSQELRPKLSVRTWSTIAEAVQTDTSENDNCKIKNGDTSVLELDCQRSKTHYINGYWAVHASCSCQTKVKPHIVSTSKVYVMKPAIEADLFSNMQKPPSFRIHSNVGTEHHTSVKSGVQVDKVTIATQTVPDDQPMESLKESKGSSNTIMRQVEELSEEVRYLRSLIKLSHQDTTDDKAPIGAHILLGENSNTEKQRNEGYGHSKHQANHRSSAPSLTAPKPTDISVDSAYDGSTGCTVDIPKPLYSSTPRNIQSLKRSTHFKIKQHSSAIPVVNHPSPKPVQTPNANAVITKTTIQNKAYRVKSERVQPSRRNEPVKATQPMKYSIASSNRNSAAGFDDPPRTHDPRTQDPRTHDPRTQDPRTHDPMTYDPRTHDPRTQDPRIQDPRTHDPMTYDPMAQDPRTQDPRTHDPRTHDPRTQDPVYRQPHITRIPVANSNHRTPSTRQSRGREREREGGEPRSHRYRSASPAVLSNFDARLDRKPPVGARLSHSRERLAFAARF